MPVPNDSPIGLQTDTITAAPAGVRAVSAIVMINGVATPVLMQVVSLSDSSGVVLSDLAKLYDPFEGVIAELRAMKRLLCTIAQVPEMSDEIEDPVNPKR